MATYLLLGNYTDQGIRSIKDTTKRAQALKDLGKKVGVTVKDTYWLLGQYDVAAILDAPEETAVTAFGLSVGMLGNVRTQTLRAFTAEEIGKVLTKVG
jgi:uncharacterized protein with GYD domain